MTALSLGAPPAVDLDRLLAGIDTLAAQRPVAAQVVAVANAEDASARTLSGVLAADVALSGRVMKLANSAYFGMSGRATTLQFAVTVVGFTAVRTMATVALTCLDDESQLPDGFWESSTAVALAASVLAPRSGSRSQDALCLGLLAQVGVALLHADDPAGYRELAAAHRPSAARRAAEVGRYGISALRLSAVALAQWGFPSAMVAPLAAVDDPTSVDGGLLRAAFEIGARCTDPAHAPEPVLPLSRGLLDEDGAAAVLQRVRDAADDLRRAVIGD
ncbi:HDOD domain-containing protein [Geodermatophilus normandii]|uniref:HDOD domain-containing protein n=1 Tax=Geodermatophilus normandii TaxID=1137989 RepID=A0A6P0G9W7_9ACTN|nr:HDOD domain-containing protein [Geodermatophilus normandii]